MLHCQGVALDVLAVAPSGRRIAISIKCREVMTPKQNESMYIFRARSGKRGADDLIARFRKICTQLAAEPWIAAVIIKPEGCYAHMISLEHYECKYARGMRKIKAWNTSPKWLARYAADPAILGNKEPGKPGIWML